jgi:two-component system chemotaxis response regulator CheY
MAKILVVDDEHVLRELMQEILKTLGHTVAAAENGMEGLTKLREGGFDAAILDVNMEQLSGLELLRLVRKDAKLSKLPIVMCTARGKMAEVDTAFESGATGYIVKPFNFASVKEALSKALPKPA